MHDNLIVKDPDILSGMPVFRETRVPVQNLIDYLTTGETIGSFLEDFPTVKREQVLQFLMKTSRYMAVSEPQIESAPVLRGQNEQ